MENTTPANRPDHDENAADTKLSRIEDDVLAHPELLERLIQKPEIKSMISREFFSGPLPPPKVLKSYETILPGTAERIIQMAEREQAHRHSIDTIALNGDINRDKRGQNYGLLLALSFALITVVLGLNGLETLAAIIGSVDLVALVTVFVIGRKSQ
ncbi:DUF2335 domain-containing protein [Aeromonas veronii]|uniref:DUF2335 domain-containing protein n=1 Tax=Aeromonas TaxID=642 RepID=UPI00142FEF3E|nr:DUF2335 domain-containing protein [Aeromonas veronii]NJI19888.1 DUF2335 domain-containing protein [Aeromonas veronii]